MTKPSFTVSIHFIDHILKLSFCWVLSEGSHNGSQLLSGDGTVPILVKEGKGLLELSNLLFGQLICLLVRNNQQFIIQDSKHGKWIRAIKGVEIKTMLESRSELIITYNKVHVL